MGKINIFELKRMIAAQTRKRNSRN